MLVAEEILNVCDARASSKSAMKMKLQGPSHVPSGSDRLAHGPALRTAETPHHIRVCTYNIEN